MIDSKMLLVRNDQLITNSIEGQLGILDVEAGKYYALDSVGLDIWEMMKEPICMDEIVEKLLNIYDISREVCYNDIKELLEDMILANIIIEC